MPAGAPTATSAPSRLTHIDALRGIAALWVVLFHEFGKGPLYERTPSPLPLAIFTWGHLGVAIFFVLSGFVVTKSLGQAPIDGRGAGRFLARRYARLLPPYYVSILIVLAFAGASTVLESEPFLLEGRPFSWTSLLAHLTLLQAVLDIDEFSSVYWSLCYEAMYYAMLALLAWGVSRVAIRSEQWSNALAWVLAPTAVAALALGMIVVAVPAQVIVLFYAFLAGAIVQWAAAGTLPTAALLAYLIGVLGIAIRHWDPFALTVVLTCAALWWLPHRPRLDATLAKAPFQFLGKISYSVYLIHAPLLSAVGFVVLQFLDEGVVARLVRLGLGLPVLLGSSWLMWSWVERPSIRWSRRLAPARSTTSSGSETRVL